MTEAKISFHCPGCEEFIGFPGHEAGTVQECPACHGWVDVPELSRTPGRSDPLSDESARQFAESARHLAENDRLLQQSSASHAEWQRQLEQAARYQNTFEEMIGRFAALVTRWEALTSRLEKNAQEKAE
jgi:hypothetical protein